MMPVQSPTSVQSPLTLVMPMKSLKDAQDLEKQLVTLESMPPDKNPIRIALNAIGTVHFARFVFLDGMSKLAVITVYDGEFDKYIHAFIDTIGEIFDGIMSHVADAPPNLVPVKQNRVAFIEYVREHDEQPVSQIFSAYPGASVMRIRAVLGNAAPVV